MKSIECSEILHRLITKKSFIHQGKATSAAFLLREQDKGLSVNILSLRSLEDSLNPEKSLKDIQMVSSLHTGHVQAISGEIYIQHSPTEINPGHAEIMGIPQQKNDLARAEYLAGKLRDQARTIWQKPSKL